jgi:hypothetical protein
VLIIAPTPYRAPGRGKRRWYYCDPAYLATTDLDTPSEEIIQAYLARWQIEFEHRDLKTGLGVGQAEVWNDNAVARLHAAHVAFWLMVKLAALCTYGLLRTAEYQPRPAWYPQQPDERASQADIVDALKAEIQRHGAVLAAQQLPPPRQKRRAPLRRRIARQKLLEAA